MNFKYKELFVLFAIFEAINGLALGDTSGGKSRSKDLSPVDVTPEKLQNASTDKVTTESVSVLIPNPSNIISKSGEFPNNASTANTTSAPTVTTPAFTTPTTLVAPPVPQPKKAGRWVIQTAPNITCIIAEMQMQLNITYPGKNQKVQNAVINVPDNSSSSGSCKESGQFLNISWGPGYWLLINFGKNETVKNYFISGISLNVNATILKNLEDPNEILRFTNSDTEFATPLDMSYKCNKIQNVSLKGEQLNTTAVLQLKNVQYEAYMNKTKAEFAAAQDCDPFDTPDIVPIAVGCALAILVLVVLVAYLIARKRSHNQGYLSM